MGSSGIGLWMALGIEAFVSIHMSVFVLGPLSSLISKKNQKKTFWKLFLIRAAFLLYCDFFVSTNIVWIDFMAVFVGAFIVVPIYTIFGNKRQPDKKDNKGMVYTETSGGLDEKGIDDKAGEVKPAPAASKKLVSPQDFDPVFSLPEDECIDSFISSEMEWAGIADGKGMIPAEVLHRKNILNVIFAVLVYIYISLIFFHFPLTTYVAGLVVLITYSILSSRYSLKKYIKKEATSRPQEKISNIIMNVKASLVTDYSKKLKTALMAAAVAGSLITFINPKIMYEEAENGVNVRFYTFGLTNMTSAVIPESYKGEAVVGLRGNTFSNMFLLNEVTLPDTITEIRGQAFKNCQSLESVELPANLNYLGGGAFYNCSSLEQIELPDTLEFLGGESFYGCTSLEYVKLSDKLTEIRGNTFENCQSLVSIEIPDSVERIGGHAFYGNESLTEVVISPDSRLSEIGSSAFRLCSSLREITLPRGVYINERAFKETYAEIRFYE